ncbi:MAG: serine/threonine-protein kinase [Thermoanaerobaculia bacterium]|nr:serine/threonine-protein kinase [Thermoanaerobaculia bacterium]
MGEVWRAKDTRLEREVAIKILPSDFAANVQFKARFEREAKTISQLNHPNVCTLFDVGHHEGTDFLVMELIEGESLADRLVKGALPLELVLRHGAEIASALDAAHRQGIVHRDLKPGNVMLTKSGAKLLDFGLAKSGPLLSSTSSVSQLADNPTEHKPLTEQGTILGTFQYMAPEQLEGQEADARTDIFSFGAVLYEMATGRRAFQGKNKTSLIAAIVSSTPTPLSEIAPLTPPALDHVIKKCLAKDADDRWQSIRDVADQLQWIGEAGSKAGEAAPVLAKRKSKLRVAWGLHLATALLTLAATLGVIHALKPPPRVVRSTILPPDKMKFDASSGILALSPDGRRATFIAGADGAKRMLWVRSLDALTAQPLAGTEDATHPFWSPDSRFIAFFSGGKLRKIDANGGPPQVICDALSGRGGAWNAEGTILFTPNPTDVLYRVPAAGGKPVAVTALDPKHDETSHRHPSFLPDGVHFIFLIEAGDKADDPESGFGLWIGSLESKEKTRLLATNASARYSKTGHILFLRDRTLVAQRFDAKALKLEDEAVPVAENLARTIRWEAPFSVSDNGFLSFQAGANSDLSKLILLDRDGKESQTLPKQADYRNPVFSHDGRRIAAVIVDPATGKADIWVLDVERGTSTRLTFDPSDEMQPVWSPDDRYIYFTSRRQGKGDIFRKQSSGIGTEDVVLADSEWSMLLGLTADGKLGGVMTQNVAGKTEWDISLLNVDERKSTVLLQTPFSEVNPMLSRDGKWLAYNSTESGRAEVYVQRLDGEGGKWQISTDGGNRPRWSRAERELVFVSPDFKLMLVDVELGTNFKASVPRLFMDPGIRQVLGYQYDITNDGSRVMVSRAVDQAVVEPVTLVQNWAASLGK